MAVLRDVAKHAKVSITTASMVLTGQAKSCRIAPATEDRVFAAAKSLNYRPSYQKRMVRRGRADVVGFVMSFADRRDLGGAFWHAIQEGAETRQIVENVRRSAARAEAHALDVGQHAAARQAVDLLDAVDDPVPGGGDSVSIHGVQAPASLTRRTDGATSSSITLKRPTRLFSK